jgi:cyanophycin synthetase
VQKTDGANWAAARRVLLNRGVQAGVMENGPLTILSEGLAYDRCQVGIVTNLDPEGILPEFYIDDAEQLAKVLRTQVDVVLPDGTAVLNADDPLVADMAGLCDGKVIFFGRDAGAPVIAAHRVQGGRAVFLHGGSIVLANGAQETVLMELHAVPLTEGGTLDFQNMNVLAAVAAAWALDVHEELIRAGIETFDPEAGESFAEAPDLLIETPA